MSNFFYLQRVNLGLWLIWIGARWCSFTNKQLVKSPDGKDMVLILASGGAGVDVKTFKTGPDDDDWLDTIKSGPTTGLMH